MNAVKVRQVEGGGQATDDLTQWGLARGQGSAVRAIPFLTREELAGVLQVSIRTVDAMVAAKEILTVRLRGIIVRFYLPDVVRALTATALTRKRGRFAEEEDPKAEFRNPRGNH
jgi:hypothetical protein